MEAVCWLSLISCILLFAACGYLYLDLRGARRITTALAGRLSQHDAALASQGLRLDTLGQHVGSMDARLGGAVADLELRTGRRVGELDAALGVVNRVVARLANAAPLPALAPAASPYRAAPSGEARERRTPPNPSAAPVETEGDRAGINPGDPDLSVAAGSPVPPPSSPVRVVAVEPDADEKYLMRLRAEANEDERDRARAPRPPLAPPISRTDEGTKVFPGRMRSDRPTMAGGVAPDPLAGATRPAEAFRKRLGSSPTLVSMVAPPSTPPATPPRNARQRISLEDQEAARRAAVDAGTIRPPAPPALPAGEGFGDRDSDGETRLMELPEGWSSARFASTVSTAATLTAEELAKVDRMAHERGISHEAMLAALAETGITAEHARAAGPTTPPSGPANDAPPPSGKRRT